MHKSMIVIGAGLLAASAAGQAKAPRDPEAQLAQALAGRVAGSPVSCITQRDIRSSRIFDRIAILYEGSNGTYYLNRPKSGARSLDRDDILVTDTHSGQLCSIDTVKLLDQTSHMYRGFVGLDTFVPYPRPRRVR